MITPLIGMEGGDSSRDSIPLTLKKASYPLQPTLVHSFAELPRKSPLEVEFNFLTLKRIDSV